MRFLLYNIRYGAGAGRAFTLPFPGSGFVRGNKLNIHRISEFIEAVDPDVVGLIEVDTGSIRSGGINQAETIARSLGHYSTYQCKYGVTSLNKRLPVVRKQGNAFLSAPRVHGERFHYFDTGIKRLIIELELDEVALFLVHLSLKYRHRSFQLRALYELLKSATKPVIVAGDFNTFWGEDEIFLFMEAARLSSANRRRQPSYPARAPRRELDFILYGPGVKVTNFDMPRVQYSDHLPLICDFEVQDVRQAAA